MLAAAAAVALIAVFGRAHGTRRTPEPAPPRVAASARPQPVPPAAAPDAPLPPSEETTAPDTPDARPGRGTIPLAALARATAQDYRRRARFPRSSQPLEPDADPIVRDREVTPVRERGRNGEEPGLTVFPLLAGFESPEPAVLLAYLSNGDSKIPAREIAGTVMTADLAAIGTVAYRDDGTGGDQQADDRVYTALFVPAADDSPALSSSYLVRVTAVTRRGEERIAATSFLYSNPHAHLTGNYRDAVVDGSLAIDAEVEVTTAGRFHLEGSLYSADGSQSIAWAQNAVDLPPGRHWIALSYYGLILREKLIDGPYLLRYVALSTTTQMPNAKNRLVENAYVTGAHRVAAFTDQPFNDPAMLDAAERVERDLPSLGALKAGGDS